MLWSFVTLSVHISELTAAIMVGVVIVLFLHLLIIKKKSRVLRENDHELKEKEEDSLEVLYQRNHFKNRNKNIEDSLRYAQRIQMAMFTPPREMKRLFPDSFIIL